MRFMATPAAFFSQWAWSTSISSRPAVTWCSQRSGVGAWRFSMCSARTEGGGVLDTQVLVDLPGGVAAVEGVEVDAAHAVVQQVAALLGGPVDADASHRR